ncbi:TIGR02679 family protein [Variovorax sp. PDC80]|uniref:TIGR02679 family protein n=1 Tax=Variovorax sp. PDC80 TaxID=1882827 RepID=UPI0008E7E445|nr:TIGR02679 family protein [Variovorax sp. PDC80]SFO32158.1 TIGR02679 family protein [Variovorax sp. PDC80]
MNRPIDPRLHKVLGGEHLAALRQRLRGHFERADPDAPPTSLRLTGLIGEEREALALLVGRPPRTAKSMQIDTGEIDAALLRAGIAASLREALEQLDGPIVHLATEQTALRAAWASVVAAARHPALAACLLKPTVQGLLKRLSRQDTSVALQLLADADAVLRHLPASGMARARLAAETLGDAHALDAGRPTATLVLTAWRQLADEPPAADEESNDDSQSGERVRDVWARAGVLVNELARPALFLNLPLHSVGIAWPPGEPGYLSLRRLLRAPPAWAVAGRTVFVCENPNVVAIAADVLGRDCAPLICTDGMPAAAQRTLMAQLVSAGAQLRYHGDFDWSGLHIANHVFRVHGASPWRFHSMDYESATAEASHARGRLPTVPVEASWDPELAPAMRHRGLTVAEEAVIDLLLQDLRISN